MADEATQFEKINHALHDASGHMHQMENSTKHISGMLINMAASMFAFREAWSYVNMAAKVSPLAKGFQQAVEGIIHTRDELSKAYENESASIARASDEAAKMGKSTKAFVELQTQVNAKYAKQLALNSEIARLGTLRLVIINLTVAALGKAFSRSQELNDSLIEANAALASRWKLMQAALQAQGETGAAFRTVIEAQRALIHYGFETDKNYRNVLRTVIQLKDGVGLSTHEAAELATVVERQANASFQATANIVATLVDQTTLAGNEAQRLATNLARAMGVVRPGGTTEFPQILKLVGQYEDAIKRFGGQVGDFDKFIAKMLKPEGAMQAGLLGINPNELMTESGVKKAMDHFYAYAKQSLDGITNVQERAFRVRALAESFDMSDESVVSMMRSMDMMNNRQVKTLSLQERYNEQMKQSGEGLRQMRDAFVSLTQRALYPVVVAVNTLTGWIAEGLKAIARYRPAAIAASVIIGGAIVAAIIGLKRAARAFWEVVVAAQVAAKSLKKYAARQVEDAVADAADNAAGGAKGFTLKSLGAMLLTGLKRLMSGITLVARVMLATPLGLIVTLLGGALTIWSYMKLRAAKAEEARLAADAKLIDLRKDFLSRKKTEVFYAARYGNNAEAEKIVSETVAKIKARSGPFENLSTTGLDFQVALFSKALEKVIPYAQSGNKSFGTLSLTQQQREDKAKENLEFQKRIAENTQTAIKDMKKSREEENRRADEREKQEALRMAQINAMRAYAGEGYNPFTRRY